MRQLVIDRLTELLNCTQGYGIPKYFDCPESDLIKDPAEFAVMTDKELLESLESTVGFGG